MRLLVLFGKCFFGLFLAFLPALPGFRVVILADPCMLCDIKILAPGWLRTRLFAVFARSVLFGFILRLLFWPGYGNTTSEGVGLGRVWPWLRVCGILAAAASGPRVDRRRASGLCFWRLALPGQVALPGFLPAGPGFLAAWIVCFCQTITFAPCQLTPHPFCYYPLIEQIWPGSQARIKKIMPAGLIFRWLAEAPLKKSYAREDLAK